ncbi:MAG: TonB-dependent receptor [Flavobacteriaceae bacterium]
MNRYFLLAAMILVLSQLKAHEISGTIYDSAQVPLEGVGVYNKTTGGYTYTDISGYYELDDVSVGDVIFFYSLGYENKEISIEESQLDTNINIVLMEAAVSLDQVVLVSKVNALSQFVNIDVLTNPVKSSQEILQKVPGLIIGQHAGGGKAEQIFLRGFDVDHGTDVAIQVDGLPVNMVSHAHGQGYADMHFIIPETIENIDFGKGPYYAQQGNFNTAGYIQLQTKKSIKDNYISLEAGQFNTLRAMSMLKIVEGDQSNAYLASEFRLTDGFFDASQNFNRVNILGRYHYNNKEDQELTVSLSHFQSKWDASGQIPQREVDQGLISRFGAIDSTEGGNTSRSNILINHTKKIDEHKRIRTNAYLTKYDFELYSNFTFFLVDPINGDQIKQKEDRTIIGVETRFDESLHIGHHDSQLDYEVGVGVRYDDINDVELSRTVNRDSLLSRLSFGNTDEINAHTFGQITYKKGRWSFNPGLRIDYFKFDYEDKIPQIYTNLSESKVFVGPKLNVIFAPSQKSQLYVKTGYGFHSNDARVVTANSGEDVLPGALGADLGGIFKPLNRLVLNAALWSLFLEQEFVYVGDEAIVEPSGRTRRLGVDLGVRYQITDWLFLNGDLNYAYARSIDAPEGEDFIPLAPDLTSTGGLTVKNFKNFSGGINYRYIKDRPANEDNSAIAEGYLVTDMNLNYQIKNWSLGIIIENLFDTEWNETQFLTESRLFNEPQPVEEIHFTPGSPFFIRGKVTVSF